jgi:hypothetical protein
VDLPKIEHKDRMENRRHRRIELEVEVTFHSASGLVLGRTLDISTSGISAILPVELQVGETMELEIKLPMARATAPAVVRGRNVFRHGFEFVQPLRDVLGHEAGADPCQSCGGSCFVLQALDAGHGVAFRRIRCPGCDGTGRSKPTE